MGEATHPYLVRSVGGPTNEAERFGEFFRSVFPVQLFEQLCEDLAPEVERASTHFRDPLPGRNQVALTLWPD